MIPHLKELTTCKQEVINRQIGFKIMNKVVLAHGLIAFDSDLFYRRLVQQMSCDKSWRIRKQFADFVCAFLEPLHEYRKRDEMRPDDETKESWKPKYVISKKAKLVKRAFKTIVHQPTLNILSDGDDQVAIEGVNILTEFHYIFPKHAFEEEYIPRIIDIFKNAIENRISVSQ